MARRVLIADATATSRIALKAALATARYDVQAVATAAEAIACLSETAVDIVIADRALPDMSTSEFCTALRQRFGTGVPPIVLLTDPVSPEERVEALAAGADTLMVRPLDRSWLLTNLRSLLRAHEARSELRRRNETASILGFAEEAPRFEAAPHVAVVSSDRSHASAFCRDLKNKLRAPVDILAPDAALVLADTPDAPEVFVLCLGQNDGEGLDLLAELRARRHSRRAAILVEFADDRDFGARALDQGANDLIAQDVTADERALRIVRQLRLKREADRLRNSVDAGLALAAQDELTGLYNRRYAMSHLAGLAGGSESAGREFCVLMVDVDHFKKVNDSLGHVEGDRVLARVAEILRENVRPADLVARIGGEEFMIVLTDTGAEAAMTVAERIRGAVSNATIRTGDGHDIRITVSIGVSPSGLCPTLMEPVLRRADAALYQAKRNGRNATQLSELPGRIDGANTGGGPGMSRNAY